MPNYVVRTKVGHEAVGLFAVIDLVDLIYWIYEVTDPANCEYAEIGSGSIIWTGPAIAIPATEHDWDSETRPALDVVGPHGLGGVWFEALIDDSLVFTPLVTLAANEP